MKIAMFTDAYWPRVNGVTVSVDTFSLALIRAGHEVMIVCSEYPGSSVTDSIAGEVSPAGAEQDDPLRERLKLLRVPSRAVFFSGEDRAAKLSKRGWVEEQLDAFSPEVVHINTEFFIADFGFGYAKKRLIPAVYTFHTIWEDYAANYFPHVPERLLRFIARKGQRMLLKKADLIIVPTPQIEEMIRNYRVRKEIRRLPTGVDPALFRHTGEELKLFRTRMEEKFPAVKGKRLLLFAGRVSKEKNISFIIKIFPELLAVHSDLALIIAGNGPYLDYFKNEAKRCGVEASCVFTGYLKREELSLVYGISHIFLLPSLTETQGLVTIEAMLSGIPVVAVGALGTVQVMGGDNGGFMVKHDRGEFRDRVLDLLGDDELYRKKALDARRHAQAWTIDSLTEKLIAIYSQAPSFRGKKRGRP
ncbi:MAG: glycosyltransferase [Treponema sp.]|jgi:glycosyltransferase involved in cell wall biosynthesis|nr:glycosyltransferase [Treponema sp.]